MHLIKMCIRDRSLPVSHADSLCDVSADGFALSLRERAQASQNHLAVHVGGINVFLFKDDSDAPAFQHPDIPDAVQRVSCKPGDGFGQNHINFPAFAQRDHFIELRSLPRTCLLYTYRSSAMVLLETPGTNA